MPNQPVDTKLSIDDRPSLNQPPILSLNNLYAKETSALTEITLAQLVDMAFYARGIDHGASAFLIALDHQAPYDNPNFNWFKIRYETFINPTFIYIDRIIVAQSKQGQGLARTLYEDLFQAAKQAGHHRVVCEVNIDPPNPASDSFHQAMGFLEVGQATLQNTKTVRYFEKKIS